MWEQIDQMARIFMDYEAKFSDGAADPVDFSLINEIFKMVQERNSTKGKKK